MRGGWGEERRGSGGDETRDGRGYTHTSQSERSRGDGGRERVRGEGRLGGGEAGERVKGDVRHTRPASHPSSRRPRLHHPAVLRSQEAPQSRYLGERLLEREREREAERENRGEREVTDPSSFISQNPPMDSSPSRTNRYRDAQLDEVRQEMLRHARKAIKASRGGERWKEEGGEGRVVREREQGGDDMNGNEDHEHDPRYDNSSDCVSPSSFTDPSLSSPLSHSLSPRQGQGRKLRENLTSSGSNGNLQGQEHGKENEVPSRRNARKRGGREREWKRGERGRGKGKMSRADAAALSSSALADPGFTGSLPPSSSHSLSSPLPSPAAHLSPTNPSSTHPKTENIKPSVRYICKNGVHISSCSHSPSRSKRSLPTSPPPPSRPLPLPNPLSPKQEGEVGKHNNRDDARRFCRYVSLLMEEEDGRVRGAARKRERARVTRGERREMNRRKEAKRNQKLWAKIAHSAWVAGKKEERDQRWDERAEQEMRAREERQRKEARQAKDALLSELRDRVDADRERKRRDLVLSLASHLVSLSRSPLLSHVTQVSKAYRGARDMIESGMHSFSAGRGGGGLSFSFLPSSPLSPALSHTQEGVEREGMGESSDSLSTVPSLDHSSSSSLTSLASGESGKREGARDIPSSSSLSRISPSSLSSLELSLNSELDISSIPKAEEDGQEQGENGGECKWRVCVCPSSSLTTSSLLFDRVH